MPESLPFTSDADIARIGHGLLAKTLPKPKWTHAAHFAACLWLLAERPELDAAREMPLLIQAYNVATGVANTQHGGYHATITLASVRAARAHLHRHRGAPVFEIANALMQSDLGHPDWLLAYWSRKLLFSPDARLNWCEPDIRNLPDQRAVAVDRCPRRPGNIRIG